jgi:hypothetical protein
MINRVPNHPYDKEVTAFRQQLDDYHAMKKLANRRRTTPRSEAQRFYELGLHQCQSGEIERGRATWQQLVQAFGAVETEMRWVTLAQIGLRELPPVNRFAPDAAEIGGALRKAREHRAAGRREQAEAIWNGLEQLYRDDPNAAEVLNAIRLERQKQP